MKEVVYLLDTQSQLPVTQNEENVIVNKSAIVLYSLKYEGRMIRFYL